MLESCMYDHLGPLKEVYEAWMLHPLSCCHHDGYALFNLEDEEEVWDMSAFTARPDFTIAAEFKDVSTPGMSIGYVIFGTYQGRRVILEQNASPIMVYI